MKICNQNDNQLVLLLTESNQMAFEEVYSRYWFKMYSLAYHLIGTKEEAEEIVQDLFENLWRKREELNIVNLKAYLIVSTKNKCTNHFKSQLNLRKYQEFLMFTEIQNNLNSDEVINFADLEKAVEKAMGNLPDKTSEIFRKSRFENQSVKEIAQQMHLTEKAVEYHITKSLKALKEDLKYFNSVN